MDASSVSLVAQDLMRFASQHFAGLYEMSSESTGRGGAVRRRKSSDSNIALASRKYSPTNEVDHPTCAECKAAATAADDLLQLATASSRIPAGRLRTTQAGTRTRDAKPYHRRWAAGRGAVRAHNDGDELDCWLPGGFWWDDNRTPMPSGRQPGELAGWKPLAGERIQQRIQEQREALSHNEQIVQVGGRAAYSLRLPR